MPQNFLRGGNCPDAAPKLIFNIAMADAISADDRLARQAMEAFRRSQRPDGLINADTPTVKSNVIPAFSIYYLLMVHDHMMYLAIKRLLSAICQPLTVSLDFLTGIFQNRALWGKVAARSCVTAIGRLLTGLVCGIPVYRLQPERAAVRLQWKPTLPVWPAKSC